MHEDNTILDLSTYQIITATIKYLFKKEQLYILLKICGLWHLHMDVIYQAQKTLIYIVKRSIFPYGWAALQLILVPWNIGVSLVGLIFITNINYSCISICQRQGICEHGLHPHHTLIKAECILARAIHSIILTLLMSRYINHRMFIYIWKAERSSYSHRIFGLCGLF